MAEEMRIMLKSWDVCDVCCLRYEGWRRTKAYTDAAQASMTLENGEPPPKKQKFVPCKSCVGLLQTDTWADTLAVAAKETSKRSYNMDRFACGLSAPISLLVREHSISLHLKKMFPNYFNEDDVVSLKEAWKWSFGPELSKVVGKTLDSGSTCPFLVTVYMEYADDNKELEILQKMAPKFFSDRKQQRNKYRGEDFTKNSVETVLRKVQDEEFVRQYGELPPDVIQPGHCKQVECLHNPVFLAGRYTKYSRELSQTPWILEGKRMMPLSVQDIIFKEVAKSFGISDDVVEHRLKFMSSGREDVDVRCLGTGRPFAIEVTDPLVDSLTTEELTNLENEINKSDLIKVHKLAIINREHLTQLKHGEETKTKSYRALCIKLGLKTDDSGVRNVSNSNGTFPSGHHGINAVTDEDLKRIASFTNCPEGSRNVILQQKTPLRVLHRRTSMTRERVIFEHEGVGQIDGHPNLFVLNLKTQAGTYVKEFVHGDFGRTTPNLVEILGCQIDIIALDVMDVALDWPIT